MTEGESRHDPKNDSSQPTPSTRTSRPPFPTVYWSRHTHTNPGDDACVGTGGTTVDPRGGRVGSGTLGSREVVRSHFLGISKDFSSLEPLPSLGPTSVDPETGSSCCPPGHSGRGGKGRPPPSPGKWGSKNWEEVPTNTGGMGWGVVERQDFTPKQWQVPFHTTDHPRYWTEESPTNKTSSLPRRQTHITTFRSEGRYRVPPERPRCPKRTLSRTENNSVQGLNESSTRGLSSSPFLMDSQFALRVTTVTDRLDGGQSSLGSGGSRVQEKDSLDQAEIPSEADTRG